METPAASLQLSVTSSNLTLVPLNRIVFGGSGSTRTVTVTPAANQYGTSLITVTVTDGNGGSASEPFLVTVTSSNDPPTISAIADQTIPEDTSTGPLSFTVSDVETPAASLQLSATSSNLTLVPLNRIVFGGSGSTRTVTVTPAANQYGTSLITVTVTDGNGGSASEPFLVTVTSSNDLPTISAIADQTISEDTSTGPLSFTVSDVETPAASLQLSATSSNLTLVPLNRIVFGGSGSTRTVTVTPAANQYGTSLITVTVTDGNGGSASEPFLVTVTSSNDLPTISAIADQTIPEDTSTGPLSFTVSDVETPAASLQLSVTSSNLTLVPLNRIVFGGSGSTRTVTVTPAANQYGTSLITVTVTDGNGGSASEPFLVTVTSSNDPPTISAIADQTIPEDTSTGPLSFTVSDVETPAASLQLSATSSNLTLVPLNGIVFGGSGSTRR